ncbi:MAG TPA: hypothetical protein VF490_08205, partial [Chryseosolibacter sp.]
MKIVLLPFLSCILLMACKSREPLASSSVAFTGATIIDGSGSDPIPNGVLLVDHGRVTAVGSRKDVLLPRGTRVTDVSGKTIIPGFINTHGHVGDVKGIEPGHYSTENIIDNLRIYARYGITSVVSLGGDGAE